MNRKEGESSKPKCPLAHLVLNKLSVIIGSCDLALEESSGPEIPASQLEPQLRVVREMAWDVVRELRARGCELDQATKSPMMAELCRKLREGGG
jgi:hypothetical protein